MASIDLTSADPILKQLYKPKNLVDMALTKRPGLGVLPKSEDFRGRNMPLVIQYAHPQGRSATFSTAQSNANAAKFTDFLLTRKKDYGVATVDGETAEATEGDSGAFISALAVQVDGALKAVSDSLAGAIYRNGKGSIGQVGSFSTNTVTLKVLTDAVLFEVGMTVQVSATDGGSARTGSEVIAGVNRVAGTLTSTAANWTDDIAAIANNDYIFVQGDLNLKVSGFDGWIPGTAPTSGDSWYGVDRSVDDHLSGLRYDASDGQSTEEAAIGAQSLASTYHGSPSVFLVHNTKLRDLQKGAQSKTVYQRVVVPAQGKNGAIASIGYRGIVIDGDDGPITVIADPRCPAAVGWMLTVENWSLNSIGPAPKILMKDGLRIQRQATSDGYEVRCGMYGNVGCVAPGWSVRVKWS